VTCLLCSSKNWQQLYTTMWGSTTNVRGAGCAKNGTCCFCQQQNPLKCQYKVHSISSRKTANFIVTATRTSNLLPFIIFCLRTCDTHTHCGTSAVPLTLGLQKSRLSYVECGGDIQGTDCCKQI